MAIILNIDTALDSAIVCVSENGEILRDAVNNNQKDHASWLHKAIQQIMAESGKTLTNIDAVAVSIGPGSYTGLRVGLSAAKGFCFALNKPLISIGTLEIMANAVEKNIADYVCPVIDARRMEIFMALYDKYLQEIVPPSALIVETNSFMTILNKGTVLFSGNAINKLRSAIVHPNAIFNNYPVDALHIAQLSAKYYEANKFDNLAYTEPLYIKEFYSPLR